MKEQELIQFFSGFINSDRPWDYSLKIFKRNGTFTVSIRHNDTTYQFTSYSSSVDWLNSKAIGEVDGVG